MRKVFTAIVMLTVFVIVFLFFASPFLFSQTDETQYPIDAPPAIENTDAPIRENEIALAIDGGSLSGGVTIWSAVRIFLVLALVALAIYGFIYLYRNKNKTKNIQGSTYLKILASAPINAKSAAAVIAVGKQAWLVGLSETSLTLISEIGDQQTINAMLVDYSAREAELGMASNFFTMLQSLVPPSKRTVVPHAEDDTAEKLRKNRERLRDM
jgi:flagellar biogenesis protein FliO